MMVANNATKKAISLPFYHGLKIFTNPLVVETTTKKDSTALLSELLKYSTTIENVTPQHKFAFCFQMLRHKFTFVEIKKLFLHFIQNGVPK